MFKKDLFKVVEFIREIEKLKTIYRSGKTSDGRRESTAEHSWRLALLALVISEYMPEYDTLRFIQLALIHDLGEIDEGDIPAIQEMNQEDKYAIEEKAMSRLANILPNETGQFIYKLWLEYEEGSTKEARIVRALDKIETIIQHNQGLQEEGFDYEFNLEYGKALVEEHDILKVLRAIVDASTLENVPK